MRPPPLLSLVVPAYDEAARMPATLRAISAAFAIARAWRVASRRLGLGRFAPKTDFWPLPAWLDRAAASAYRTEAWWLRRHDLPFGVSVASIARRGGS